MIKKSDYLKNLWEIQGTIPGASLTWSEQSESRGESGRPRQLPASSMRATRTKTVDYPPYRCHLSSTNIHHSGKNSIFFTRMKEWVGEEAGTVLRNSPIGDNKATQMNCQGVYGM